MALPLLSCLLPVLLYPGGAEPKLAVEGDVARSGAYTVEDLKKAFAADVKEIKFTEKGVTGTAHAFPLAALVTAAQPRLDPKRKHADFSLAIVAIAEDGYSAVFSGAEVSSELSKGDVWVALDWNGKPIAGDDAPVRLIVSGDSKPSRWVHGVRTFRILNLAPKVPGPEGLGGR